MRTWSWWTDQAFVRLDSPRCMEAARLLGSVALSIEWADEACVGHAMQIITQLRLEGRRDAQLCLHASPGHHAGTPREDLRAKTRQVIQWIQEYNANAYADPIGMVFLDCEADRLNGDAVHAAAVVARKNRYYAAVKESLSPYAAPVCWYGRGLTVSQCPTRWCVHGWFSFVEATEPGVFSCSLYSPGDIDQWRGLLDANRRWAAAWRPDGKWRLQVWVALACGYVRDQWRPSHDGGDMVDDALRLLGRSLRNPSPTDERLLPTAGTSDVILYSGPDKGDVWMRQAKALIGP